MNSSRLIGYKDVEWENAPNNIVKSGILYALTNGLTHGYISGFFGSLDSYYDVNGRSILTVAYSFFAGHIVRIGAGNLPASYITTLSINGNVFNQTSTNISSTESEFYFDGTQSIFSGNNYNYILMNNNSTWTPSGNQGFKTLVEWEALETDVTNGTKRNLTGQRVIR